MHLAYLIWAISILSKAFSTRFTKSGQFFSSAGDQIDSAMASALGHIIYCTDRKLGSCSVQRFACPPRIYFGFIPGGTGSKVYVLLRRNPLYTGGSTRESP